MRPLSRTVMALAVLLGAVAGLAGCTPASPAGLRKEGDRLVVVLGGQCSTASHLTRLRLRNMDEARNESIDPPLWEIEARQARAVPEVVVGTVPDGYAETVNNLAGQGIAKRVALSVSFGDNTYATTLDTGKIRDGKILDANRRLLSADEFRKEHGC